MLMAQKPQEKENSHRTPTSEVETLSKENNQERTFVEDFFQGFKTYCGKKTASRRIVTGRLDS